MSDLLLLHGGVGADRSRLETLNRKLKEYALAAFSLDSPLDRVVNAVVQMEDDSDFNAGTGSVMRLDGSIQMDAAVMVPDDFGAVIGIERVKNPVLVARAVMEKSPHIALSTDGAVKFARIVGYEDYDPSTPKAKERLQRILYELKSDSDNIPLRIAQFRRFASIIDHEECDTVGAVARVGGRFAAAVSTGGTSPMMRGRVGDSPIVGAGVFCGQKGAVVATGLGEEIAKRILCFRTYSRIGTAPLMDILIDEVGKFGQTLVGLIAVDTDSYAYYDNGSMPVGVVESEVHQ